uniref:Uncharacterized protein n=1 Tax=Salix viminalis TaxID=40686 RepID=A0A6N2KTS8_SALVM
MGFEQWIHEFQGIYNEFQPEMSVNLYFLSISDEFNEPASRVHIGTESCFLQNPICRLVSIISSKPSLQRVLYLHVFEQQADKETQIHSGGHGVASAIDRFMRMWPLWPKTLDNYKSRKKDIRPEFYVDAAVYCNKWDQAGVRGGCVVSNHPLYLGNRPGVLVDADHMEKFGKKLGELSQIM